VRKEATLEKTGFEPEGIDSVSRVTRMASEGP
jgi:hypothetical protein